jgi:hypothetical protein
MITWHSVVAFAVAPGLRILPYFAALCRANLLIFFVLSGPNMTLDQHIGVRIPGGAATLESITLLKTSPHGSAFEEYQKGPYWRIVARGVRHTYVG